MDVKSKARTEEVTAAHSKTQRQERIANTGCEIRKLVIRQAMQLAGIGLVIGRGGHLADDVLEGILNVAQIPRRDAAHALCGFGFSSPSESTAWKRWHEFRIELNAGISRRELPAATRRCASAGGRQCVSAAQASASEKGDSSRIGLEPLSGTAASRCRAPSNTNPLLPLDCELS